MDVNKDNSSSKIVVPFFEKDKRKSGSHDTNKSEVAGDRKWKEKPRADFEKGHEESENKIEVKDRKDLGFDG